MGYFITDENGNRVPSQEGGNLANVEILSDDTTLTVEDSGKTYLLDATGEAIVLPAAAKGVKYDFIVIDAIAVSDWTIDSPSANIQGYAKVNYATVAASNETTITIVNAKAIAGDTVSLISDGTNWYVKGEASVAASITFADNS